MTIHRAKGLEFPVCCVADLGRGPMYRHPLIRVSGDGRRLGLRIGRPGSGGLINALDYEVLRDEAVEAEQAEERRLFYVAMTRARERLILSGAGKPESWEKGNQGTPVDWIVPAFKDQPGVRFTFLSEGGGQIVAPSEPKSARRCAEPAALAELEAPAAIERAAIASLSYSSLSEYARCGYRFYAERVLRLPPTPVESAGAVQRGIEVHAALQELDFERPVVPAEGEVGELVRAFLDSPLRTRLKAATHIRREQAFAFPLDDLLVTGTFDVLATDDERALVVDYNTDRDVRPYDLQQVVYALAALRAGHPEVEVVHLFLVDPARPVLGRFTADDMPRLEATLRERAAGLRAGRFEVTDTPFRAICAGCPAAGGLCSWPVEVAMRPAPDRLC
jgi:ATP-dependent exoDNAse (exonuclease V) beta subunit